MPGGTHSSPIYSPKLILLCLNLPVQVQVLKTGPALPAIHTQHSTRRWTWAAQPPAMGCICNQPSNNCPGPLQLYLCHKGCVGRLAAYPSAASSPSLQGTKLPQGIFLFCWNISFAVSWDVLTQTDSPAVFLRKKAKFPLNGSGLLQVGGGYLMDRSWIRPCQYVHVFGLLGTPPLPSNLSSEMLQAVNNLC